MVLLSSAPADLPLPPVSLPFFEIPVKGVSRGFVIVPGDIILLIVFLSATQLTRATNILHAPILSRKSTIRRGCVLPEDALSTMWTTQVLGLPSWLELAPCPPQGACRSLIPGTA